MKEVKRISPSVARRLILDMAHRAGVGHIGSALSVVDILCALYGGVMSVPSVDDADRDRFVMSKGHAASALYAVLSLAGLIKRERLEEFCQEGGSLGVHPGRHIPGIDFSTGSLGHGLSYGAGAAWAARLQRSTRRVFVLLSDAELNAGSTWEAIQFAAHHRLGRLTAIVDANGWQAFGATREVMNLEPMTARFDAFGWETSEVPGHDLQALHEALVEPCDNVAAPRVIIARTTLGKGVSFMENNLSWHYFPLTQEQYQQACAEVEGSSP